MRTDARLLGDAVVHNRAQLAGTDLVIVAYCAAARRHAGNKTAVAVANLDLEVPSPAVVAECMPTAHCGCFRRQYFAEAALACDLLAGSCMQRGGMVSR